ncbi:hypothetical protein T439DRAFT_1154 [Meredithblackwellia eburnea MCA 4105]
MPSPIAQDHHELLSPSQQEAGGITAYAHRIASPRTAWSTAGWGAVETPYMPRSTPIFKWSLRRLSILAIGTFALLVGFHTSAKGGIQGARENVRSTLQCIQQPPKLAAKPKPFDKGLVLNFKEPQDSYRVQLKTDVRYITTMSYGGHANQFISIYNLLFLGKLLRRVVIIPTLIPLHFDADPIPMSAFFDIERFIRDSKIPSILLSDMKYLNMTHPPPSERVSCWSVHERVTPGGANGNDGSFRYHSIDVDYWALPEMRSGAEGWNIVFDDMKTFDIDKKGREEWIKTVRKEFIPQQPIPELLQVKPKPEKNLRPGFSPLHSAPPNDQLLCLDTTLFIGSHLAPEPFPGEIPLTPLRSYEGEGWVEAGQHLHFNAEVEGLADHYLRALFNVSTNAEIPPLITVHIRRTDFKEARGLTTLKAYTDGVERVRQKLQERIEDPDCWRGAGKENAVYFPGVNSEDYAVVATTDEEPNSPFVQELKELGWKVVDHDEMRTVYELGEWYPTIVDQAILARGRGFVGTEWSTYSYLAGLRVKYWNGGVEEWTPSL